MRRSLPLLALLLATAAACGRVEDNATAPGSAPAGQADNSAELMSDAESPAAIPPELPAPRVRPSRETGPVPYPAAAPGVAFDYSYAFRLEAERIAETQQEHQRLCARYGPRCRITGMDYRSTSEEDVQAMLSFLVDPEIAGQFGRESVRAAEAADGELVGSEIGGTEVGTAIKANTGAIEEIEAELERVEARLARRGLRWRERARLDEERRELRRQLAALRSTTEAQERQLATVPMLFRYGSGAFAPGPAPRQTVSEAAERAADTFVSGLSMLLIVFVTLSPWLLTALLVWGAILFARRRLVRPPLAGEGEAA